MKRILFYLLFIFSVTYVKAQEITVDILQQGTAYSDSSYYDIIKVEEDEYWICGKYGILKSITSNGVISNVPYPSATLDIYKLHKLNNQKIIASADKGTVFIHDLKTKTWQTIKVKGYEKACFYNLEVDNDNTIYISGGNSKIAHSGKAVPNGFIIASKDMGKTWKKLYSNTFNMVWCVKKNPFDNLMYALMYTPNKTHLYQFNNNKWVKNRKIGNSIFHEIQFDSANSFVATGGWVGKKGRITTEVSKKVFDTAGLIWSRVKNEKYTLFTGCNGNIIVDIPHKTSILKSTKLNKSFSIYEAIFTNQNTAFAIGSGRTILKITINDNPSLVQVN